MKRFISLVFIHFSKRFPTFRIFIIKPFIFKPIFLVLSTPPFILSSFHLLSNNCLVVLLYINTEVVSLNFETYRNLTILLYNIFLNSNPITKFICQQSKMYNIFRLLCIFIKNWTILSSSNKYQYGAVAVEVYNFFFGNNDSYESIYINIIIKLSLIKDFYKNLLYNYNWEE